MVALKSSIVNTNPYSPSEPLPTHDNHSHPERGQAMSRANIGQPYKASMLSYCSSYTFFSLTKEYALKVAREANMDINTEPCPNKSWAD